MTIPKVKESKMLKSPHTTTTYMLKIFISVMLLLVFLPGCSKKKDSSGSGALAVSGSLLERIPGKLLGYYDIDMTHESMDELMNSSAMGRMFNADNIEQFSQLEGMQWYEAYVEIIKSLGLWDLENDEFRSEQMVFGLTSLPPAEGDSSAKSELGFFMLANYKDPSAGKQNVAKTKGILQKHQIPNESIAIEGKTGLKLPIGSYAHSASEPLAGNPLSFFSKPELVFSEDKSLLVLASSEALAKEIVSGKRFEGLKQFRANPSYVQARRLLGDCSDPAYEVGFELRQFFSMIEGIASQATAGAKPVPAFLKQPPVELFLMCGTALEAKFAVPVEQEYHRYVEFFGAAGDHRSLKAFPSDAVGILSIAGEVLSGVKQAIVEQMQASQNQMLPLVQSKLELLSSLESLAIAGYMPEGELVPAGVLTLSLQEPSRVMIEIEGVLPLLGITAAQKQREQLSGKEVLRVQAPSGAFEAYIFQGDSSFVVSSNRAVMATYIQNSSSGAAGDDVPALVSRMKPALFFSIDYERYLSALKNAVTGFQQGAPGVDVGAQFESISKMNIIKELSSGFTFREGTVLGEFDMTLVDKK